MRKSCWHLGLWVALGVLVPALSWAAKVPDAPLPPDVRVLVDISGSMKQTDPKNLRQPALDLLIKMFPADAKAGVWTFAQGVNLLIPHAGVDASWRSKALPKVPSISSVGLRTNIGAALEKAGYDLDTAKIKSRVSLILLTDGKVDISPDAAVNAQERERILKDLLPRFRSAGVRIHTVALSSDADRELLEALAVGTGGVAAVATTAEELTQVFVQAFDQAVPAERVPFQGKKFHVDESVKEFTALIFRAPDETTQLTSPDGVLHDAAKPGENLKWYKGANYDLITVSSPAAGDWAVPTTIGPSSRVTVISDLKMVISPLDSNLFLGDAPEVVTAFRDGDKEITEPAFLKLLDVFAIVGQDGQAPVKATLATAGDEPASDGAIAAQLPVFAKAGEYTVTFRAESKTFNREQTQHVTVRELFALAEQQDPQGGHTVSVSALNAMVDAAQTQLAAKIRTPAGKVVIQAFQSLTPGNWFLPLELSEEGNYVISVEATGKLEGGKAFSISLPKLNVEHVAPVVAEPKAPEHAAEKPAPEAPAPAAKEESGWTLNTYLLVAGIVLAHIVVIGLGVLVYRKVREGAKSAVLDADAEDNAAIDVPQPAAAAPAMQVSAVAPPKLPTDDLALEGFDDVPAVAAVESKPAVAPSGFDIDDDIIDIAPGGDDEDNLA